MSNLHYHKKYNQVIINAPNVFLPMGEKYNLGATNFASIYVNGAIQVSGIHYVEIEDSGFGIGFTFLDDDIQNGDVITIDWAVNFI